MQKKDKDKPAVKPSKAVCERCECHGICQAEDGQVNYTCPKMICPSV